MSHPAIVVETQEDKSSIKYEKHRHGALKVEPSGGASEVISSSKWSNIENKMPEIYIRDNSEVKKAESLEEFFLKEYPDLVGYPVWIDGKCFKRLDEEVWIECRTYAEYHTPECLEGEDEDCEAVDISKTEREIIDLRS